MTAKKKVAPRRASASRTKSQWQFAAPLVEREGAFAYGALELPPALRARLPEGRLRIKGKLNEIPIDLALQYRQDGTRFLMVLKALARQARLKMGERAQVVFWLTDPDQVDLPEELSEVLAQDEQALAIWNQFTPGRQRSLAHYVKSAKSVDVRIRRSFELLEKAKAGTLFLQRSRGRAAD